MAIPADEVLRKLPPEEQAAIAARARELVGEYLTLQDLRKARALTQERVAELLGVKQENVSRIEKRSDLLLSTLIGYVAAMGGRLRLVAEFPDRPPVELSGIGADDEGRAVQEGKGRKKADTAAAVHT